MIWNPDINSPNRVTLFAGLPPYYRTLGPSGAVYIFKNEADARELRRRALADSDLAEIDLIVYFDSDFGWAVAHTCTCNMCLLEPFDADDYRAPFWIANRGVRAN